MAQLPCPFQTGDNNSGGAAGSDSGVMSPASQPNESSQ